MISANTFTSYFAINCACSNFSNIVYIVPTRSERVNKWHIKDSIGIDIVDNVKNNLRKC